MPSQTWVARFVVDHGQVTEEGGRLRTFQRRRLDEPEIDLHILAEPTGPKADEFGAQALEAIGRDFVKDTLSLTGGLRRALLATNQVLLDWNRRSIAREQVGVGVVAAVVRGTVVYMAQAGPTLVFARRGGRLTRLVPEASALVALGEGQIEPEIRRFEMEPGDVIIASSLAIESLMDEEALDALLERGTDVALPELYLATRDQANFALYAITCLEGQSETEPSREARDETELEAPPTASRPAVDEGAPPEPVLTFEASPQPDAGSGPALTMPPPLDISRPVVRLRNDQFSGRVDYPRTTGAGRALRFDLPLPRVLGITIFVGIAVFIAAFTVPDLVQQNRQAQASTLLDRALATYSSVQLEQDPSRRRSLLEDTRRLASEALRKEPDSLQASEVRAQAGQALSLLDNIVDLGGLQAITTLGKQVTGDVAIDRVAVGGGSAYLLDSRGHRIIMVPLTPPGPPVILLEDGQSYGGSTARRPQYMAWDASGNRLLVLDSERKLYEVRPGSVQLLGLRRTASWASVADVAAYDGNLYVLDPKANQVYKYLPAANGFDSEPTGLLSSQSVISNARALSVQEDLLVLTDDGKVRRFRGGSDTQLSLSGIDRPLSAPSTLIAVPNSDQLYIADSGNKRIVVANRDGVFVKQLVSNSLTDVKAVAVDGTTNQLYVVVGDALLSSAIPK